MQNILVFSDNIKNVYDQIIEAMQGMMADFEISGINESTIIDVYPYDEQKIPENLKPLNSFEATSEIEELPEIDPIELEPQEE